MTVPTVREQQRKCKDLRKKLIAWIERKVAEVREDIRRLQKTLDVGGHGIDRLRLVDRIATLKEDGIWTLGGVIAKTVLKELEAEHIQTFSNVLSVELRRAQRRGDIRKRIRPGTVYVEYTTVEQIPF